MTEPTGTPKYQAVLMLIAFTAAFGCAVAMHLSFTESFRAHLEGITSGQWTDTQKLLALLQAGRWVPAWRVALVISTFLTFLFVLMSCFGFEPRGPSLWVLLFILLFFGSNGSQNYRASHTEGDAAYRAMRLLEPDAPHTSFWEELLRSPALRTTARTP